MCVCVIQRAEIPDTTSTALAMRPPLRRRNCGVYLGARGVDRAKDARIRAKKARDKRKNRNFQVRSFGEQILKTLW